MFLEELSIFVILQVFILWSWCKAKKPHFAHTSPIQTWDKWTKGCRLKQVTAYWNNQIWNENSITSTSPPLSVDSYAEGDKSWYPLWACTLSQCKRLPTDKTQLLSVLPSPAPAQEQCCWTMAVNTSITFIIYLCMCLYNISLYYQHHSAL